MLGLTLLAHTAAALLLAGIILTTFAAAAYSGSSLLTRARLVAVAYLAAFVVASPYLWPILTRYALHVVNRGPATWIYVGTSGSSLLDSMAGPSGWPLLLVEILGAIHLWRHAARETRAVLIAWAVLAPGGLIYSQVAQRHEAWPAIVPAFHFLCLLRAWHWILFGSGLIALALHWPDGCQRACAGRWRW